MVSHVEQTSAHSVFKGPARKYFQLFRLFHYCAKVAMADMETDGHAWAPIKLYWYKQVLGQFVLMIHPLSCEFEMTLI